MVFIRTGKNAPRNTRKIAGLIIVFDRDRSIHRIDGNDCRSRGRRGAGGSAYLLGHGDGGIRIDDKNRIRLVPRPFPAGIRS
jgi:hypothetical protein